ncbi:ABC-type transport auxiliary lipoprotein family protein [Sulfurimonas paralvinellae]|uniref:ABC-type transport auxiliary lipoprotein component domain-containing protein n=1 Tax=Sulfurimonas paralvinellae TaxID=317658 RepID=A0A7M1B6S3_9BACT|nr:ABC-type transport auxiliary lipoprotein family protein [Sulfurimonas paralvinellae]QOP45206.1 hypothetical protein FM071_02445 [Sulfurimonas paralvinellae]
MKILVTTFLLLVFTACSTTYPAVTQYRLTVQEAQKGALQSNCKEHSLKVSQAFVKSSLVSKEMKYTLGAYQEGRFNRSEWAEDLNRALSDTIVSSLEDSALFQNVTSYKSLSGSDYTLETRVSDFTQHFSDDQKSSVVKVDMTFTLIDNKTGMAVSSKHIVKEMPTKSPDAKSGVEALNQVLNEVLHTMHIWIAGTCQ